MEAKRKARSGKPFSEFRKEHQHSHINSETFESKASIKSLTKGIFAVGREGGFAIGEGIAKPEVFDASAEFMFNDKVAERL